MIKGGYAGNILNVDLTTGEVKKEPLDFELVNDYIGGWGINNRLAYDLIEPGIDPLSPENPIIIGAGVCVGTMVPASAKLFLTTKFPLNGAVGTATSGGSFAHMLKYAGYDHLIITGRADKPVYLKIFDDDIRMEDASDLWGKDIEQTTDELWNRYEKCSVICIGQAGENLVNISFALVDKVGTLGKGGLGALMSSKNLKAIIAHGTKGIKVADEKRFKKTAELLLKRYMDYPLRPRWIELGTLYFLGTLMPDSDIYGLRKIKKAPIACPSCPVACKLVVEIKDGEYAGLLDSMSSYANPLGIGIRFSMDYKEAVKCGDVCDRYGLDSLTVAALIDFAIDLYKKGIINEDDTDGLSLERDFNTFMTLTEKIAKRDGFGDVMADGVIEMAKRIGGDSEKYAYHIKGFEPVFDPTMPGFGAAGEMGLSSEVFVQIITPRGGAHNVPGLSPTITPGRAPDQLMRHCKKIGASKEDIDKIFSEGFNVAVYSRCIEDWYSVFNTLGICSKHAVAMQYDSDTIAELYSALTGIEKSPKGIFSDAEKATTMQKLLNVREGFTRKDDSVPERWLNKGIKDYFTGASITKDDMDKLIDVYYEERGWDSKGIPTREKLVELGLGEIVKDMEKF